MWDNTKWYRHGFNGKENDNDVYNVTGSFQDYGMRGYNTLVCRFISVDPKASKYPYWSPYLFAANNPIKLVDIKGEGPGDLFASADAAATDWANTYNDNSIAENKEYGSVIYKVVDAKGVVSYSYTVPNVGIKDEVVANKGDTKRKDRVAEIHSHGAYKPDYDNTDGHNKAGYLKDYNNEFSYEDEQRVRETKKTSYLSTPSGELKNYDPNIHDPEESRSVSKDLPSDDRGNPKTRVNNNDYKKYSKNEPANKGK